MTLVLELFAAGVLLRVVLLSWRRWRAPRIDTAPMTPHEVDNLEALRQRVRVRVQENTVSRRTEW